MNIMNKPINYFLILMLGVALVIASCEKDENKTLVSSYNGDESHKSGEDCMGCHSSGGSGEGVFTIAGTVYDLDKLNPYPNATVKIFTGPNGTGDLVKTIEADSKGNFYTTEFMDFGNGMYTSVTGGSGEVEFMNTILTNGRCNSCHGSSTDRIYVKQ